MRHCGEPFLDPLSMPLQWLDGGEVKRKTCLRMQTIMLQTWFLLWLSLLVVVVHSTWLRERGKRQDFKPKSKVENFVSIGSLGS